MRLKQQEKNRDITARLFNPFAPNASFLYALKTLENHKVLFSEGRKRVLWECV